MSDRWLTALPVLPILIPLLAATVLLVGPPRQAQRALGLTS
jgi:hypothetical protein